MMSSIALVMLAVCLSSAMAAAAAAGDYYCTTKLCADGLSHVACNPNKGFSANCTAGATQVDLTGPLQQLIVDRHNARRWQVANGGVLAGFPTAAKMQEMVRRTKNHLSIYIYIRCLK